MQPEWYVEWFATGLVAVATVILLSAAIYSIRQRVKRERKFEDGQCTLYINELTELFRKVDPHGGD